MSVSRAVVQEGPRRLSRQEFPLPDVGPEDALLRVEACGICGSDYGQYAGALPADRAAGEARLPGGHCRECVAGRCRLCQGRGFLSVYGFISVKTPPALWGGYAQYMYLDPHALVHRLS